MCYENIDEAIRAIKEASAEKGMPMYYRGQHHDWAVTSSMHRLSTQCKDKGTYEAEMYKVQEFIKFLKKCKEESGCFKSVEATVGDLHYYAIAQHYGCKTDFIDFSTDLDVARSFALIGKQDGETGCIVCLWEDDVEFIKDLYRYGTDELTSECKIILESRDYDPFFCFHLPEIPRITNQKGIFLWDPNSVATTLFGGLMEKYDPGFLEKHTFRFKQTDISIEKDMQRRIYPSPSNTELKIKNFFQKYKHDNFYQNTGIPLLPRVDIDLSEHFAVNAWNFADAFAANPEEYYPSDKQESSVVVLKKDEIKDIMRLPENCRKFVGNWKHELAEDRFIMYVSESRDAYVLFVEVINEVLASLAPYKNLPVEAIEKILFRALRLLNALLLLCRAGQEEVYNKVNEELAEYEYDLTDSRHSLEHAFELLRGSVPLQAVLKLAWLRDFGFIRFENDTGNSFAGVLPLDIIENVEKDYKAEHLRILNELYDQSRIPPTVIAYEDREAKRIFVDKKDITWNMMLNVVRDPKVLFAGDDILEDFIFFFIPWQIVMCPKTNRIYNPYEIASVRKMDVDNFVEKYPIFYRDGGYYISLDEDTIFTEDIYIVE